MTDPQQIRNRKTLSSTQTRKQSRPSFSEPKKRTPAVFALIVLHVFLALGAWVGGVLLIVDPSGQAIGMPLSMLERSFFPDYLIPGLLLLILFGIFPLLTAYAIYRRPDWPAIEMFNPYRNELHPAWALSLYIGFGQIIWISAQMYIMNAAYPVHMIYTGWGLAILIVTLLPSVRNDLIKR
ncbi:hypothetical protein [Saccharibacillus sacchari]|uniref:Uncharacterized protein n=1 Tax=Saccharibacillus sacchari TaxID=456493 RepID=A0ACC6PI45_9BACL